MTIKSSYHASSLLDYYENHVFKVTSLAVELSLDLSKWFEWSILVCKCVYRKVCESSQSQKVVLRCRFHPSYILADMYLTGAHIAAIEHSVSLTLFSTDSLQDFYPSTFSFSDLRRHGNVQSAMEHFKTYVRIVKSRHS